ncbi:MAG: VCBS repeat-containing protein [Planctomycetes bacterium]|nr:VCBS repeat-containing protein [Planctomycetota bacterium]
MKLFLIVLGLTAPSLGEVASQKVDTAPKFAAPKQVMAGAELLGEKRAYPSPAFHDVDGDGHLDILIADLMGRVTVAHGKGTTPMTFGEEKPLLGSDKEPLDFNNW